MKRIFMSYIARLFGQRIKVAHEYFPTIIYYRLLGKDYYWFHTKPSISLDEFSEAITSYSKALKAIYEQDNPFLERLNLKDVTYYKERKNEDLE